MRPAALITIIFLAATSTLAAPKSLTSEHESSPVWGRFINNFIGFSDESGLFQSALRFFSPSGKDEGLLPLVYHTQFHATCKDYATSILSDIEKQEFRLKPNRDWPDEFSWKGGFYLTPELSHAEAYARAFLPGRCKDLGGMVVIASKKDESEKGEAFREDQTLIAKAIKGHITGTNKPVPEQDADFVAKVEAVLKTPSTMQKFTDIQNADFLVGFAPLTVRQKELIAEAAKKYPGLPVLEEPFEQVVVLTDTGMAKLRTDADDITPVPTGTE
ncbi:hypothetical protein DL96DRAFT_1688473 [Flagelloscypha sp. PMI_526]|nr:hypothetical protein DL96DRAFT_1688473 [Flagelloscypha sp. PMI_526]